MSGSMTDDLKCLSMHDARDLKKMLIEHIAGDKDSQIHADLMKELLKKVASQSRELKEALRSIEEKNRQLEELNALKNEFLGIAAHDLRSPLGTIQMLSDVIVDLGDDNLTGDQKSQLEEIRAMSDHMLAMLDELLDINAIERGSLTIRSEKQKYQDFLTSVVKMNRMRGEKKGIALELQNSAEDLEFPFDRSKLSQVMNNLLSNAFKYSYGKTRVLVRVSPKDGGVLTEVIDEGQGIPARELSTIFRPFHKSSVKSTAGEKSTGLGLAISRKIIEGHGGTMAVTSEVGKGSNFHFTLPL
jgi:signal transduction histidine kinase